MDVIQKTKEYNQQNKHTIKKALQSTQGETWQTISELTSQKSGKKSVTSLKVNGLKITNPAKISDEFNHHFFTIGPKIPSEIDSDSGDYLTCTDTRFHLHSTSTNKVFSPIDKLNKCKATGPDRISARTTRKCMRRPHLCAKRRYF